MAGAIIPITEVHELELTSVCNLACVYCPHPTLRRPKAHMEWSVFERSLQHIEHYVRAGTQTEVALTGIGEAILYPEFERALARVRGLLGPSRLITLSTNGVALTDDACRAMRQYNVAVYVSLHRPEVAGPAIEMLKRHGIWFNVNHAFVNSSLDWAGQVDWHVSAQRQPCQYLARGWSVIRQDGTVVACCMDAHSVDPIGSVFDEVGAWRRRSISLCSSCVLYPPAELAAA